MIEYRHVKVSSLALVKWAHAQEGDNGKACSPLEVYLNWAKRRGWTLVAMQWGNGPDLIGRGWHLVMAGEDAPKDPYPNRWFRPASVGHLAKESKST